MLVAGKIVLIQPILAHATNLAKSVTDGNEFTRTVETMQDLLALILAVPEWLLGQFLECNFHANPTSKPQEWSNYYHAVEQLHGKWTTKSVDKTNVEGKK